MKFKNEAERQQHPQARVIPTNLWKKEFKKTLREAFIPLMQAEEKACLSLLNELSIPLLNDFSR